MRYGRLIAIVAALILSASVFAPAAASDVGKTPANPVTFTDLDEWLSDSRSSLELFEDTIRTDVLAARFNMHWSPDPVYVMMDDGSVLETGMYHVTFQGMFWGPLFTFGVWEVPAFVVDVLSVLAEGSADMTMTKFNIQMLEASINANTAQSSEEVPVSGILRINVLFTSDVLMLDMRKYGGDLYAKSDFSMIGRTYAGLTFKILEVYDVFAGFNFVHYPHIEGWQTYVSNQEGLSQSGGIPHYATGGFTDEYLLYETQAKLFFYQNIFNFLQIRTLLNLDAEQLLDTLGVGFVFDLLDRFDFNTYFSYLRQLEKFTFDVNGGIAIVRGLSAFYKWNFRFRPTVNVLDYLKVGLNLSLKMGESRYGPSLFQATAYGVTFIRENTRQYGYYAALGFYFPLSIRLQFGLGYNSDETMEKLPFTANSLIYFVNVEIGMDNNFNYKLEPVYREP